MAGQLHGSRGDTVKLRRMSKEHIAQAGNAEASEKLNDASRRSLSTAVQGKNVSPSAQGKARAKATAHSKQIRADRTTQRTAPSIKAETLSMNRAGNFHESAKAHLN